MIKCFSLFPHISAAFWGRKGGVIKGEFGSLNCAFKTYVSREEVIENHNIISCTMGNNFRKKLYFVSQKHSCDVHLLTQENMHSLANADAIITNLPNILIGVLTADCCPILLYEDSLGYIAAIHAGWRGALGTNVSAGIIENTLYKLFDLGCKVENIKTAIGPCIKQQSYEVGKEFKEQFLKQDLRYQKFFISKSEKYYFDLPNFIIYRLQMLGVRHIEMDSVEDTFSNSDLYFSYRYATKKHKNQCIKYGCQASVIGIIK